MSPWVLVLIIAAHAAISVDMPSKAVCEREAELAIEIAMKKDIVAYAFCINRSVSEAGHAPLR